jgi:divalent metal cation (Fe/Co/Zn/Cd) transporter
MTEAPAGRLGRQHLIAKAQLLEWLTVGWLLIEAAVALWAGIVAQSLTLIAFGADSLIELASAVVVIWRLGAERNRPNEFVEMVERRAARLGSALLWALAAYVVAAAASGLWTGSTQQFSLPGLIVAVAAIPIMAALAAGKSRIADRIGSRALRADAAEATACAYLSGAVVVGLAAQRLTGAWWVDSVTALALVPFLVREACEAWSGEEP